MNQLIRTSLLLGVLAVLLGCGASSSTTAAPTPQPTQPLATLFPTAAHPPTPLPAASGAPPGATGWQTGSSGIELRRVQANAGPGHTAAPLTIVRLDPAQVRLQVAYAPAHPQSIARWFAEKQPLAAINGGFFTKEYQTTALLISDNAASGESYDGFGGMLSVQPDGGVTLRSLRDEPYDSAEAPAQALQSFPMLVFPGGVAAAIDDDGQRARRSALALDRSGHLLLIASPNSDFTLLGLAEWLSHSDLAIDRALNLDGGSSTGLYLHAGALDAQIDSFGQLPIVLLVEAK